MSLKNLKKPVKYLNSLFCEKISPRFYLEYRFKKAHNYKPDFKNPSTHSEHIVASNLIPNALKTQLADKIAVRQFIAEQIGSEYLIPAYATMDFLTQEIFNSLPNSFALKANHASATNLIVKDKSQHKYSDVRRMSDKWLSTKFHQRHMEMHYKDIKPALIAEELLLDENEEIPSDYKVHYFKNNGHSKFFIQLDSNRFSKHTRDVFDSEWNQTKIQIQYQRSVNVKHKKP